MTIKKIYVLLIVLLCGHSVHAMMQSQESSIISTQKALCRISNPPMTTEVLQLFGSIGLTWTLITSIRGATLFNNTSLKRSDILTIYALTIFTAYCLLRELRFTRSCERLLYKSSDLSQDQISEIASIAMQLASFDVYMAINAIIQHANIVWNFIKELKAKRPIILTQDNCPICFALPIDPVNLCDFAQHIFCRNCIESHVNAVNKRCPLCHKHLALQYQLPRSIQGFVRHLNALSNYNKLLCFGSVLFIVLFINLVNAEQERFFTLYHR